ncbi:MAG: hypothetical protein HC919_00985 [Oscillatoriales cyanobacterium SM2_2_1]|nr:hypothetical protein [Oscillatoriales cyanobacterium SM2_2_1]
MQEATVAAPPVVALPNPPAAPVTVTAPPPVVAAAPTPQHTLVGILDLGDRSAAMFEVAGAVQSIALGKPIGSSGWLIAKIKQQEVTLKRGAETKVVLVGQKF